jgi:hypothetical protein
MAGTHFTLTHRAPFIILSDMITHLMPPICIPALRRSRIPNPGCAIRPAVVWSVLAVGAWLAFPIRVSAQGSLTPPAGPITPVMRSLDQMEPRLPLQAGVPGVSVQAGGELVITNSGSYYLTGNLTTTNPSVDCIRISSRAMHVTLDLNGFTVSRTNGAGSSKGIDCEGGPDQHVAIRNGFLVGGGTNAGFEKAISSPFSAPFYGAVNVHVDNVHVSQVRGGIDSYGWRVVVRNSSVRNSGGYGINADVVTGCRVDGTQDTGISARTVSDCDVETVSSGDGISAQTVMNSRAFSEGGVAIDGGTVINSYATTLGPTNTPALQAIVATSCVASHSGGRAIQATIANGCVSTSGTNVITHKYNMP